MTYKALKGSITEQAMGLPGDLALAIDNINTLLVGLYPSCGLTLGPNSTPTGPAVVPAGAALTLTQAAHAGRTIQLDTAAGSVVTLPAATGTGDEYEFVTTVIATSNSHKVQVANGTDVMTGAVQTVDNADGTCTSFGTVAASDTITLNRTTTGSVKIGERFKVKDVKAGYWAIWGVIIATGSEATPFSAAV